MIRVRPAHSSRLDAVIAALNDLILIEMRNKMLFTRQRLAGEHDLSRVNI